MKLYGQVKGRAYRNQQPEPKISCRKCGRKLPEHEFMDGPRLLKTCPKCRQRVQDDVKAAKRAYAKALEAEKAAHAAKRECPLCGKRKPETEFVGHGNRFTKECKACRTGKPRKRRLK